MSRRKKTPVARQAGKAEWSSKEAMQREFRDPSSEYGPIDCWWWEAAHLSREKMRLQLEDMKDKGVAGTWFYPRFVRGEPLQSDPPYWSDGWWDFTSFSMQEHKRLGLVAWISDWTAHGFFQDKLRAECRENPAFIGRRLAIYEQESPWSGPVRIEIPGEEQVLHAAAYRKTDAGLDYASQRDLNDAVVNNRLTWTAPAQGWIVTVITAQPHDLDYLNSEVADRWLEVSLGEYEARFPDLMGNVLQAYGPDEMYILNGSILYSPLLRDRFKAEKGYDLLPYLAGIFRDIGDKTDKIRCEYYDVMVSLLDENFYGRIADWLHERGMRYTTIATWGRQRPVEQTYHYGDFFRMMRHFDVTGNEDPGPADARDRCFIDAKLSSSIAHLYERDRVAVCAYWGSGWGVTQEQNLAWTFANYAWGMNLYNRHGGLYSTLGGWYEWVPPAVHFRQPYWQYWKHFTDFVRRLSYVMSLGQHVADVAILYPLSTMHAGWSTESNFSDAAREAASTVMELAKTIYRSGIDFDFVDDPSLCRAQVSDGKLNVSALEFQAVLLPALTTIRSDTLEKLREFYAAGGTLVAFGRLPDASPEHGRSDPNIQGIVKEVFGVAPGETPCAMSVNENGHGGKAFFVPDDLARVAAAVSGAIARDVTVSEGDVFHTHQKAPEADIYLLFNPQSEKRRISATLRASGAPEIWDPFTGDARPVHRFEPVAGGVKVRLDVEPHQGIVLVVAPREGRPRVIEDDVDTIAALEPGDGGIQVQGLCESAGHKRIRLLHDDVEHVAEMEVEQPPEPMSLDGLWSIRLEPTMDNSWGDFRYPPSKRLIGPEARRLRYMEENELPGIEMGWHLPDFDDADWPQVTCTYGPYWWSLGPFGEAHEPTHILEKAVAGGFDAEETFHVGEQSLQWEQISFSMKYGSKEPISEFGGMLGVSEEFLVFGAVPGGNNIVRYLFAHVLAREEGEWMLEFGGEAEFPRQAWLNGEQVIATSSAKCDAQKAVRLREGRNAVLLRLVQPEGREVRAHLAFFEPSSPPAFDPYVPLVRWFKEPGKLLFDITPDKQQRVGWYRFAAPPGLKSMRLKLNARSVEAWANGSRISLDPINGSDHPSKGSEISIPFASALGESSKIALRVGLAPGCYGGAAFEESVIFDCEEGEISLGDWCGYGLEMYSGGAVYSRTVNLTKRHLEGAIHLDLGRLVTVAEVFVNGRSAGVKMARPFRFDITDLVAEGENALEVKVTNTLANHMVSYATRFVYPGQTASGLLGPVRLVFLREVTATAVPQD